MSLQTDHEDVQLVRVVEYARKAEVHKRQGNEAVALRFSCPSVLTLRALHESRTRYDHPLLESGINN